MNIQSFSVPVRIIASHGFNQPGFKSARSGIFCSQLAPASAEWENAYVGKNLLIFDTKITQLSISKPSDEEIGGHNSWQILEGTFDKPQDETWIRQFLENFTNALSVAHASHNRDPWYGTLYADIDWFNLSCTEQANPAPSTQSTIQANIQVGGKLKVSGRDHISLSDNILNELDYSPYTELFFEGLKAAQPKAKFINWFVLLEELEQRKEFKSLFTPLFSQNEKDEILKNADMMDKTLGKKFGEKLGQMLGNPNLHVQSRPEKLMMILQFIGIHEIETIQNKLIPIDVALCKLLIKVRNNIAHKGSQIDTDLLFNVLFVLAKKALEYLNKPLNRADDPSCERD